jgi:hypothetical protein
MVFNVAGNNKTYLGLQAKCPILTKFDFFNRFSSRSQTSNFTKIRPVGTAEPIHADRRTDMTELIGAFSRPCDHA